MWLDVDVRPEETDVETILRRVQHRLRRQAGESLPLSADEYGESAAPSFQNLHIGPDVYFQLDYAARIYDPRTVPGNTRFVWFKSFVMRVMRIYTTRQVEFNATVLRILNRFFDVLQDVIDRFSYFREAEVRLQKRLERAEHKAGDLAQWLDTHRERLERAEENGRGLDRRLRVIEDLHNKLQYALSENAVLRQRLESIMRRISAGAYAAERPGAPGAPSSADTAAVLNDQLYFPYLNEDRGTEDDIRARMTSYITVLRQQHLDAAAAAAPIIDIGCGRGEFLDLCREAGLPCRGVDINEDMVAHCRAKGHEAVKDTAVAHLGSLPDNSLRGVIACHVVEHLPPAEFLAFVKLTVLKLAPGGIAIVETPNPQTVFAMTLFYRDITHQRPVHPDTLRFLFRELGMREVTVRPAALVPDEFRLKPCNEPCMDENIAKLNDFLFGCLDYTVLAVK
ncbi:methyltransferase domain-containing protein [bacterium]|nr:methyltransferase domain-containing protein [bacterium]